MLLAESKTKVALASNEIVPPKVTVPQPPTVFIEYVKLAPGVPLIVTTFPEVEAVTPVGNPVTFTLVAPPPKVY